MCIAAPHTPAPPVGWCSLQPSLLALQHLCAQQQLGSHSTWAVTSPEVPAIPWDLPCSGEAVVEAAA